MKKTVTNDPHVLVVDDEPMIRHLIGTILERHQIKSDFAENGHSALEKWKSGHYQAIMMDINMPVMDGFEAVAHIRREEEETDRPYTPVIAVTSLEPQNDSIKKAGFDHYIKKPFDVAKLLSTVMLFLRQPSA